MKVILNNTQLKKIIKLNQNIGFVTTIKNLHKFYILLIKESNKKSQKTLEKQKKKKKKNRKKTNSCNTKKNKKWKC